ncbi:TIGR04222 domain-containing membrane protein [Nocardia araoensis]|uniref:TIGR04222 domain-containing membrane protein n=1 Tax=Nocardia araoensis TaxID=228600 RepID=UPI00030419C0|nr:TIGR04222 domain-containing membrane protein [Nocardia araoensis]
MKVIGVGSDGLVAAGDTWGISGPQFLSVYIPLVLIAVLVGIWLRSRATRADPETDSVTAPGAELTSPELGMLYGDQNAVLAAMARLRGLDAIDSAAAPVRTLTPQELGRLDPFTVSVYDRLAAGQRKTVGAIAGGSLDALRTRMVDLGYFPGPEMRHGLRDAGIPILVTGALGLVRIIAGASHGNPVGVLVVLVLAQAVAYWLVVRKPRLTALGVRARDAASERNRHLRPSNSPSYATYGAESAALAAAVFGIGALVALDPGLAQAVAPPSASGGGDGGGDSGGDGGGCGSGCGGGCGGCGG